MTINKLLYRMQKVLFIMVVGVLCSTSANAALIGSVTLPDNVTLNSTETALQLNGLGYRTKFVFKIYIGALYTESRADSRDAVQALKGPKRVLMHIVYDEVSREKMAAAWNEGFEDNNSDAQLAELRDRLNTFVSYFPDLKAGDEIMLDYIPASGTHVTIKGEEKGVIAGDDFYSALLDVWLGDEPADSDLKDAMLGRVEE